MKTLAFYSIKGGVGKTSTAVNVAWIAAERGARVLLWDLDPQSAATWTLRVRGQGRVRSGKLLRRRRPLPDLVTASDHPRLDLLPAALALRKLDHHLARLRRRTDRLRERASELAPNYDLLVLDCPPGLGLLGENVFVAADALAVPLIPSPLSIRTLEQLAKFLADHHHGDRAVLPFFSMLDRRKRLHRTAARELPARLPHMLGTVVPMATDVERMGLHRAAVGTFAPHGAATKAYEALYEEIAAHLWGSRPAPSALEITLCDLDPNAKRAAPPGPAPSDGSDD